MWHISHWTLSLENCTMSSAPMVRIDNDLQNILYGLLAPAIIGLPGNLLAIAVASRKQNKGISTSVYIIAMGVADSIFLLEVIWYVTYLNLFDRGLLLRHVGLLTR